MTPLKHTAAYWASENIVLQKHQAGYETDTGKYKIGDGISAWNSLTYVDFPQQFVNASGTDTYVGGQVIPGLTAYYEGLVVRVKFENANTGACTYNQNDIGAADIFTDQGNDLLANDIRDGGIYELYYTGSNWQISKRGGSDDFNIDGGHADTIYTAPQVLDGGGA